MDLRPIVATQVRAARLRAGLTQVQLAEATGVTDETIGRIERGESEPSVTTLHAIAEALKVSMQSLVTAPPATR